MVNRLASVFGTPTSVNAVEEQRHRLLQFHAWLAAGAFTVALGTSVVAPPVVALADTGTQSSSGEGSHGARGGASTGSDNTAGPRKHSGAGSGSVSEPAAAVPDATTPGTVTTRSVVISGSAAASDPGATPSVSTAPAPATPQAPAQNPWSISTSTNTATVAAPPAKADAPQTFNGGFGNVGSWNFGSGNQGDWNLGNGNLGSENIGSGNLGSKNFGIGNSGDGNVGGGNTGNGNIGFGNTGNNNIGFGLTGDNQIGFGGFNSGAGNTGLFNSGNGNNGWFNSGNGNWGNGNSGNYNTGSFNVGDVNTGDANIGKRNTGSFDIGHNNSGFFNTGSTNTGDFNSGDLNTGWFNSGNSNTGLFNSGYLNTGVGNSGNASNGFFEKEDNKNWFPGLHVDYTIPGISIDRTFPFDITQQLAVGPLTVNVGPTTTDIHVTGSTGPIKLTVFDIPAGPGFFNTGAVASSGIFNTGAGGGSGILNTGVGLVSGFFNLAALAGAGLSGFSSSGSGSGFSNLGSGVSGWRNTSSLSLTDPAFLSGFENLGAALSGAYVNQVTGGTTFNLGSGNVGSMNFGDGNKGSNNIGAGNLGGMNLGFGNGGDGNVGSGNTGNNNYGGGNEGFGNIGSGNLGAQNFGWGNNGSNNFGGGNTGNGNIGFGNTGTGNIGIGLTGDYQFGFGGLNSGTGNMGLFNSGTGNTGIFNSGTKNWGFGNSGTLNTGFNNSGNTNTGLDNSGDFNTGSSNVGSTNTGNANVGNTNTGVANIGNTNSGWSNTGNTNTGWVNTGSLNTGAFNTANGSNGLFWRRDAGGQLNIDLGADLSQVPITLTGNVPVNIPITAKFTDPVSIPSITLPETAIPDISFATKVDLGGIPADVLIKASGALGPITFPGTNVNVPELVGTLGGPGTSIPIELKGTLGPGRISLLRLGGPGLFNSSDTPSSGLFNYTAGGGSGFFNSGALGSSGWMNTALQAGASGANNTGSGSGFSNTGSAISGYSNTSSIDPALSALVSGLLNIGTNLSGANLSGVFVGEGSNKSGVTSPKAAGQGWTLGVNTNVDISEIPITLDGNIGVNVPLTASLTGPITIDSFTLPVIPGKLVDPSSVSLSATLLGILSLGPAVIPLTTDLGIGPITVPDITLTAADPLLSGLIGGPDTTIPIHISGAIGPNNNGGNAKFSLTRTDTPGYGANIHANVANTPIKLNGDIPVNVPVKADFGDLTIGGVTIPGFNITTANWQTVRNSPVPSTVGNYYLDFNVPSTNTTLPVSDIKLDPITVDLPTLTGAIGGPGAGIGLNLDAGLGNFTIDVPVGLNTDPLGINLDKVQVSKIPLTAILGVGVNIPVNLDATPIRTSPITINPFTAGTPPNGNTLQALVLQGALKPNPTPPRANSCITFCLGFQLSPVVNVGAITLGPLEAGFPDNKAVELTIGGAGKGVAADVNGLLGPIVVSLANGTIEKFPYSYAGNIATDIPIDGATGPLDLQQLSVAGSVQALLYQRVAYCTFLGFSCTGTNSTQLYAYFNGGNPVGSAPGPFPPNTVPGSTPFDVALDQQVGPLTLLESILINAGFETVTPLSGSGTLGPFNLGG